MQQQICDNKYLPICTKTLSTRSINDRGRQNTNVIYKRNKRKEISKFMITRIRKSIIEIDFEINHQKSTSGQHII